MLCVATQIFKDYGFDELISIVSPAQMYRKTLYYIEFGVIPLNYCVSTFNMFHSYIYEIFISLPNMLINDSSCQNENSKTAINNRNERCVYLLKPITNINEICMDIVDKAEYISNINEMELEKELDKKYM